MTMYCTGNHKNYKSSMTDNLQNFEIIIRVIPNLPCTGSVYTLNDKKLTIDISENKSDKPGELDCIQNRVVEKELKKSEKLVQISQINLDNLEAIPNVICTGGISYSITLKKREKKKQSFIMAVPKHLIKILYLLSTTSIARLRKNTKFGFRY